MNIMVLSSLSSKNIYHLYSYRESLFVKMGRIMNNELETGEFQTCPIFLTNSKSKICLKNMAGLSGELKNASVQ